jgi:hypothetical protein
MGLPFPATSASRADPFSAPEARRFAAKVRRRGQGRRRYLHRFGIMSSITIGFMVYFWPAWLEHDFRGSRGGGFCDLFPSEDVVLVVDVSHPDYFALVSNLVVQRAQLR